MMTGEKEKVRSGQVLLLALLVAVLLVLPLLFLNGGQLVPKQSLAVYQTAHDAIRAGGTWDDIVRIGSVGSYWLGSPFFWLTLPFPNEAVPYLMAPLMVLKLTLAAFAAYLFCRRFVAPPTAMLAGVLYAFSGFSLHNLLLVDFHEILIYLPLMLWAVERYMSEGKRGWLALIVCLSALGNVYFCIGQVALLLLYWIVRLLSHAWRVKASRMIGVWVEVILGVVMAGVLLLPLGAILLSQLQAADWDGMLGNMPQSIGDVLYGWFFPRDILARAAADGMGMRMSAWLPLFGMTGVIAYLQSRKHTDWLRRMVTACAVLAVLPAIGVVFRAAIGVYCAQWQYGMVLFLALATVSCLDDASEEEECRPIAWKHAFFWSIAGTLLCAVLVGLDADTWNAQGRMVSVGPLQYSYRFWIYASIVVVGLVLTGVIAWLFRKRSKLLYGYALSVACAASLCYGWYTLLLGKSTTPSVAVVWPQKASGIAELPPFAVGICVTAGAVAVFGLYLLIGLFRRRKNSTEIVPESQDEIVITETKFPPLTQKTPETDEEFPNGFDLYSYYRPSQEEDEKQEPQA